MNTAAVAAAIVSERGPSFPWTNRKKKRWKTFSNLILILGESFQKQKVCQKFTASDKEKDGGKDIKINRKQQKIISSLSRNERITSA